MKIYYDNFFDDYNVFASSTSGAATAINVQEPQLVKKWISLTDTDEYIKTDAASAIAPTAAFVLATNLTDAATVKVQGHTADTWAIPDVDITMTRVDENLYYAIAGFSSKRYWRFHFDDAANPDEDIKIGRLWLGSTTTVTKGASRSFTEEIVDTSEMSFSKAGQISGDVGYRYKRYNLSFPYWTDTMKTTIDTFVETVIGGQSFVIALDENNITKLPFVYTILEPNIGYNHMNGLTKWNSKLNFREVK